MGKRFIPKVKNAGQNVKISHSWTISVTIGAFFASVGISALTAGLENSGVTTAVLALAVIVLFGVVSDIIGVAVSTASEAPFHAMAARKIPGAKESIYIIRHAQQISSLCNDVIGDIAGIISGAVTAAVVIAIVGMGNGEDSVVGLVLAGLVAAVMIGGKAAGKGIAMLHNNSIVFITGKLAYYIKQMFVWNEKRNHNM